MAIPKNPLLAQYKDPTSKALINQATQAGDLASKNAMEQMNSRGMLYSTSANRAVADAQNQAVTNILPQLQQMAEQRRQQAIDNQFRQRQFNADQSYRNAQLGMERQRMNQSNQNTPNYTKAYTTANSYFDKLPNDKFNEFGEKTFNGVGLKTKAALKQEFQEALSRYSGSDGYQRFQQEKELIYKNQPDTADYLVNALENAFAYYR